MKIEKDKIEMICYRTGNIEYEWIPNKDEIHLLAPLRIFPYKTIFNKEEMQKLINLINTTDFKITIEKVK